MVAKLYRRLTPRAFAIVAILLTILLCLYYANLTSDVTQSTNQSQTGREIMSVPLHARHRKRTLGPTCPKLTQAQADIDTVQVYKDFEFQPAWMKSKEYWDEWFEQRYEGQRHDPNRPPLKVILIPHSHNDPGWLKTFEHYFHYESKQILNNMVAKLQQYPNLTFIWSEVSFLSAWWDSAHPSKQRALRKLVHSGRLEITTGGWVMTDEATSHVYAMVDQLIEGHQWLKTNLGISPKSGWSIDPFGHGSTQPYLLTTSGITGTVIQRIHYAWKQWLAQKQFGDFMWVPNWQSRHNPNHISQKTSLLTHNQPFDIYSIKHSCGPHPYICLNFDFRKIPGEYTDYSIKAQNINDKNIKQKSELLLAQYARTGSLFPHNVVLMPIGDDFRFNHEVEWDQQYQNYQMLCDYINANKDVYKTEISFGTPKDYFNAILHRHNNYPTLKGDFFVYSDIFSEGRPAYWSGYFTTRPFMKILDRELENSLRSAEILYTVAMNKARQNNYGPHLKILERNFEKLVRARRHLGLFQHHDAITGTSKSFVMRDYGLKLFESLRDTESIQQDAIQSLLLNDTLPSTVDQTKNIIVSDLERESYEKLPKKLPITVEDERKVVLFNSLVHTQDHIVELRVSSLNIRVLDSNRDEVLIQINPVWNASNGNNKLHMSNVEYELVFIANLPPLSLVTFYILTETEEKAKKSKATIYCNNCHRKESPKHNSVNDNQNDYKSQIPEQEAEFKPSKFKIRNTQPGDIQLENQKMKLLFDGATGFMKSVTRKHKQKITQCAISFAAYHSAQFHSGAYLFMPDPNSRETDKDVLEQYNQQISIIITSGLISSEVTVIYGPFLVHSVKIYHVENSSLSEAIQVQNEVDFENPPKNRETELFMRLSTDVQNGDVPEFYSDLNGFQMQKRVKVDRIGIEGNYFPITTMAYIQDDDIRLSLLTNHAQGAASWQPGFLEVMLDRRTLYDDSRGMGEGLVDNRKTIMKFWLIIEDINHHNNKKSVNTPRLKRQVDYMEQPFEDGEVVRNFNVVTESTRSENFSKPSLFANHLSNMLNYPVGIFVMEGLKMEAKPHPVIRLLSESFPCDVHLVTLRTQPDQLYSQFPSLSALMVLHRQGYDCAVSDKFKCEQPNFSDTTKFVDLQIEALQVMSLTGLHPEEKLNDIYDIDVQPMALQTLNVTFVK